MKTHLVVFTVITIIVAIDLAVSAAPNDEIATTPLREVALPETTVICKEFQTSQPNVQQDFTREISAVYAALRAAGVPPTKAPILLFPPQDQGQSWTAEVAVPVPATAKAPAGYVQRVLPACKAESMVYHGDAQHIEAAFLKLHQELAASPVRTTGELREHVLNWDGTDSQNNVLLIEAPHAE